MPPELMIEDRLLERVRRCHVADLAAFEPWFAGGEQVGYVHQQRLGELLAPPSPFQRVEGRLELSSPSPAARSAAIAAWLPGLVARAAIRPLTRELYAAAGASGQQQLLVDRAAVPWLGVRAAGVHLNGYVGRSADLQLWVARRARGKATFPGHLDNLVAGGQAHDFTPVATLQKECHEEAGMSAALAATARLVTTLRYLQQDGLGLKSDTLAIFDLELPAAWRPTPVDGEVEAFALWPVASVIASLAGDGLWKPNCALVAIDFLLRHGCLDTEVTAAGRQRLWGSLCGGAG
jgi:8-oxo-dGTP pyrophosphatase MutT (NUDIX family)